MCSRNVRIDYSLEVVFATHRLPVTRRHGYGETLRDVAHVDGGYVRSQ